jgi:hypothetical protein
MQTEQSSDFAVEVYFAPLNAGPEQRALAYFENSSLQSQTIGLHESPNTNVVADFDFGHGLTLSKFLGVTI